MSIEVKSRRRQRLVETSVATASAMESPRRASVGAPYAAGKTHHPAHEFQLPLVAWQRCARRRQRRWSRIQGRGEKRAVGFPIFAVEQEMRHGDHGAEYIRDESRSLT
jgi:hypothetical protein